MRPEVEDLCKQFERNCECKFGTCRNYAYQIQWCRDHFEDFTDLDAVLGSVKEESLSRQQNVLTALKVWFNHVKPDAKKSEYLALPLHSVMNKIYKNRAKQKATAKQADNWLHMPTLRKQVKNLRDEVFSFDKNKVFDKQQFHKMQLAFILSYMCKHPCRRDLATLCYDTTEGNYLQNKCCVFNEYKNSKHLGCTKVKLDRNMFKLVSWMRRQHKLRGLGNSLLYNKYFKPMNSNTYGSYFSKMCAATIPCCNDRHVNTNLIRHLVVSWARRNDLTLEKKEDLAKKMMHNTNQQELYRIKK